MPLTRHEPAISPACVRLTPCARDSRRPSPLLGHGGVRGERRDSRRARRAAPGRGRSAAGLGFRSRRGRAGGRGPDSAAAAPRSVGAGRRDRCAVRDRAQLPALEKCRGPAAYRPAGGTRPARRGHHSHRTIRCRLRRRARVTKGQDMNSALTRRRAVPLTFALLIAIIAAALTLTTQREAHASGTGHDHGAPGALPKAAQVAFHDQMRKLREDHVTWTRLAIVPFADGSQGFSATATRLLQNQTDIGNVITPFYGA